MTQGDRSLEELLLETRHAAPNDRIDFRDDLAKLGVPAIDAMADWLSDPELARFGLRVVGRAGQFGERDAAIRTLFSGRDLVPDSVQAEIDLELARLDYKPPKPRPSSRPSWAKPNPYDVAPLSPASGLSWPGFQRHEFGGIAGTTWRRRDDPISQPPLITQRLRAIHPHFSSGDASRSPAVQLRHHGQASWMRLSVWNMTLLPEVKRPALRRRAIGAMPIDSGRAIGRRAPRLVRSGALGAGSGSRPLVVWSGTQSTVPTATGADRAVPPVRSRPRA